MQEISIFLLALVIPVCTFAGPVEDLITGNRFRVENRGAVFVGDTVLNGLANQDIADSILSSIPTFVLANCQTFVRQGGPNEHTTGAEYPGILASSVEVLNHCNTNALILGYLGEVGKSRARGDSSAMIQARIQAVKALLNAFLNGNSAQQIAAKIDPALRSAIQSLP